jgi:predicted DCC family thiol-disulfide oxidoreductase YuxK
LKLYFDATCQLCRSFAKLLRKHLNEQVEFLEMSEGELSKDFKLELSNGEILYGKEAIDALEKEIPKVKDFFWMLPDSYRGKALHKTYALGRFLRKVFYFFRGKKCGECE